MDKNTEAKGIVREIAQEMNAELREELLKKYDEKMEANAKQLEQLPELKAQIESLQGKIVKLKTKTAGEVKVLYSGKDPQHSKNFKACMNKEESDAVAGAYIKMIKAAAQSEVLPFAKAFDASSVIPVSYGSTILGLAELDSIALKYFNVKPMPDGMGNVFKPPVKATRSTSNAVAPGNANVGSTMTLDQVTFTIDRYIGEYIDVLVADIADSNVSFVNDWIIPAQAEAMGQYVDGEAFNRTNSIFTTCINSASPSVTASGVPTVTLANLNTMYNALSWDRKIKNPMWFGPQGVYKDIMGLVGTANDHPIFMRDITATPSKNVFGCPYVVTPVIANAPTAGNMRLAFGEPSHYTILLRGGVENLINSAILMKEGYIQFIARMRADGNITDNATAASSGAFTVMRRNA